MEEALDGSRGGKPKMAAVSNDNPTRITRPPATPKPVRDDNRPALAESLIVLVYLGTLALLGLGLYGLMPR
jgi:hypothetical protein